MDPIPHETLTFVERAIAIGASEGTGLFLLGFLIGSSFAVYLINKFIIASKLEDAEKLCEAKMKVLEDKIKSWEPIIDLWEDYMKRKTTEALLKDDTLR